MPGFTNYQRMEYRPIFVHYSILAITGTSFDFIELADISAIFFIFSSSPATKYRATLIRSFLLHSNEKSGLQAWWGLTLPNTQGLKT